MTTNDPVTETDSTGGDPNVSQRELAVARSLHSARRRAENRFQRFLDAAIELMTEAEPGKDFTVQDIVDRSGQSLRLFYQYFGGKHMLLLALFEDSVQSTTEYLRDRIHDETDPLERLHRFVMEYFRLCRPAPEDGTEVPIPNAWMMVDFAQQLLTSYPAEAAVAFAPLVSLFGEALDGAAEAGAIRAGLRHTAVAGVMLEAIMFNAFSATISGTSIRVEGTDPAEELWDLLFHGVGAATPPT